MFFSDDHQAHILSVSGDNSFLFVFRGKMDVTFFQGQFYCSFVTIYYQHNKSYIAVYIMPQSPGRSYSHLSRCHLLYIIMGSNSKDITVYQFSYKAGFTSHF
ncbi:hypothetical protein GDO81_007239 [Engystomops pustulosus]|uniref:Maturase K n=1 Tax=Engystomops pustulosus TaxID=76066 RepID=A0AAV7C5M9_ENGPU|nr:hypothetical protein GDO81_007239 [Engystomops pustulosus]